MKVYISTPVTSRPEKTINKKRIAASYRCGELEEIWNEQINPSDLKVSLIDCTTFGMDNAEAMGRCIRLLLTCDAIFMDEGYEKSNGCKAELEVARIYGLQIFGICDNEIFKLKQRNDENKTF